MSEKATTMKKEIYTLSSYRALMSSRYFYTATLAVTALFFGLFNYNMAPLYIILLLNAFPPVLSFAFTDYSKRLKHPILLHITKEAPFLLNHLKTKYKYSRVSYVSNSVTYLIALTFFCLWQINFNSISIELPILRKLPIIIASVGLAFRFLALIFYRIKLPYLLTHNKG